MQSSAQRPMPTVQAALQRLFPSFFALSLFWLLAMFSILHAAPACAMDVFVSIPPQKWLSDKIGGKLVTTHVLVEKGQDPHSYEPSPRQLTDLSRAQLYFTLDLEFEAQIVPRLEKTVPTLRLIDTAAAIVKIPMVEDEHAGEHGHGADKQAAHSPAHEAGKHPQHEGLDPHVWLSPLNLKIMAATMAKAMMAADPANGAAYTENLVALSTVLDELHARISQDLAPYKGASFYVFHPAFGYFAEAYHLHQKAIETGGKSPSPKQLAGLMEQAKAAKARVIFVQPQFDAKSAQTVATAIHGEVVPLDPLAEDVLANLEIMAEKIKAALR
jgi:zinc transport system substrate-binding protein